MSPRPTKPFFATLDAMRGIAAMLVMLRHVPFMPDFGFQESYLAVDLFFLLSGVVIANAYEDRLRDGMSLAVFCWTRAVRVFPLYWMGCAVTLLALYDSHTLRQNVQPLMLLRAILMLPQHSGNPPFPLNHPAWSLFFELLINLLYALVVRYLNLRRLLLLIAVFGAGLLYAQSTQDNFDFGWSQATLLIAPWRVGFPFFLGVLLYRLHDRHGAAITARFADQPWARDVLPWVLVAGTALTLTAAPDSELQSRFDLAAVSLIFPALVALALCIPAGGFGTALARWLGLLSYPLYMLHAPLSALVSPVIPANSNLAAALFALALLGLCTLVGQYVDAPLRRGLTQGGRAGYAHYARLSARLKRTPS